MFTTLHDYRASSLPEITGLSEGSTQMTFTAGFFIFKYLPTPETVPPVPEPATKMSTLPAVSFQISGPKYKWTEVMYHTT